MSTEVSGTINDGPAPCGCGPPSSGGSLVKVGTGTLILSGVNTYTGPTIVDGGMLAIAPSGSITSNVTNNSLFLNAGLVTGNLVNTGMAGNTGTITGTATINGGFVDNDGTIVGIVTVNAGGTLAGNGTVGGAIINAGGTLSPGHSIGTIKVNGNLTFVGAGNYAVEVSPTAADRVNVTGAAGLGGTLHAYAIGTGYKIGTTYTVINAAGGVTGKFGNLDIVGDFGITRPHIEYDANNVLLVLGPNAISPLLTGGTFNQRAVAGAVDVALQAGNQLATFDALFKVATAQLPLALDTLSGEVHASTAGVLVDESLYVRSAVLGRLRQASYGGDAAMAVLSTGGPQLALANEADDALTTLLAYGAKSPLPTKAPPLTAPAPSRDIAFWSQGFGAWGKFNGDGNAATVRRDLAGFFTGVDARFGDWRGGFAAGYTSSRNNLDGRGAANVESGHLAAYGGWGFGAFRLRGGAAYAWHTIDTSRTVALPGLFDTPTGHYDGGTGQIFGEAGYGLAFGKVAVEPFAGAAFVRLRTDPFDERGGVAALRVAANAFEVGSSTLGVRAASMIPLWWDMMLVPRVSVAWQHAFDDVTPAATLAFQGAGAPFLIAGVPIARDSLLSEAGLDLAISRNTTVGLSYVGQLARNVHDHAAKGKFTWKF
jgi:outer membrane autotransporter protein